MASLLDLTTQGDVATITDESKLAHITLDVIAPQPHLCVIGLVRRGTSVHEKRPITALEEKVIGDRFDGQGQTHDLLVELLATGEVTRAENCGNPVGTHHSSLVDFVIRHDYLRRPLELLRSSDSPVRSVPVAAASSSVTRAFVTPFGGWVSRAPPPTAAEAPEPEAAADLGL